MRKVHVTDALTATVTPLSFCRTTGLALFSWPTEACISTADSHAFVLQCAIQVAHHDRFHAGTRGGVNAGLALPTSTLLRQGRRMDSMHDCNDSCPQCTQRAPVNASSHRSILVSWAPGSSIDRTCVLHNARFLKAAAEADHMHVCHQLVTKDMCMGRG